MRRLLQAMVTDERGRDVPVVRELRWPPGPIKLLRKRPALPMLTRTIAISYWIGAVYIALKAGLITVLWLKVAAGAGGSAGIVAQGTGMLLLMGMWPVPALALLGWGLWAWRGRPNAARFMASRGACPSCGGSMLGIQEDESGFVACSSCDAVWKLGCPEECPGCKYDLLGARADARGVLTCPECGLAFPAASKERLRHDAVLLCGGMDDDAGVRVPRRSDAKRKRASIKARTRREVERAQLRLFFLAIVGLVVVFLGPMLIGEPVERMAQRVMSEQAAGFVMWGALISIWAPSAIVLRWQIRKSMLHVNRRLSICPACDADMRGVPAGGDGLTPCPTCGAKWKLPASPTTSER